jgi:hypothetical protein
MKKYIFTNILNSNIEIIIKAHYYYQAMELLLSVTRNIEDYRLMPMETSCHLTDNGSLPMIHDDDIYSAANEHENENGNFGSFVSGVEWCYKKIGGNHR